MLSPRFTQESKWLSGKRMHLPMQEMQETLVQSLGGGNGNLFHCSCLENSMDRGARQGRRVGHNQVTEHLRIRFTQSWLLHLLRQHFALSHIS